MSLALRLLRGVQRAAVKPVLARAGSVRLMRWGLVAASLGLPRPFGVTVRRQWLGGRPALRFTPAGGAAGPVVLWLHGGAHVSGSPFTHRGLLGRIALAGGCTVIAPDFRLAPEHPVSVALEDVEAAVAALAGEGIAPGQLVLGGDSSGGGLALALLIRLQAGGQRVAGLILLSPWLDMTLSGDSIRANAGRDPLIPAGRMAETVAAVRGGEPVDGPVCAPLLAEFRADCPALITVGSTEVLRDDALRFAALWQARGGRVDLARLPGAPHVLAFHAPWLPEARAEIRRIGAFLRGLAPAVRAAAPPGGN